MLMTLLLGTASSPDAQAIGSSARLLLVTALLGVILVTALTLIVVLRRNRLARARLRGERSIETPDPWAEAGRRAGVPKGDAGSNESPGNEPPPDPPLG